jgi:DNA-binding CsgD family transcriptional regulator/predicted DNA-binding transcriptional regulator AlpA
MSISVDVHFHNELLRQTDLASAALLLAECAETLGWNLAAFHADIQEPTLPRAHGEFIGTAMGWRANTVKEWVTQGLARDCPIGRHCGETAEPFLWDCESGAVPWQRKPLPPGQRAVLQHYSNDVCGGITVPVRRGGRTGYVSWCSRERSRLRSGYQATLGSVHLISHTFMRQLDRLQGGQIEGVASSSLTRRELECLTWAARGRTTEEIAALLHRSSETVEFHLSNAMSKLSARTRTHAVALACVQGLIREV